MKITNMIISISKQATQPTIIGREFTTYLCALTYMESYRLLENDSLLSFIGRRPRILRLQKMVYGLCEAPIHRLQISSRERVLILHHQLSRLRTIHTGIFDFNFTERQYYSEWFRHTNLKRILDECTFSNNELVRVDFNAFLGHESPRGVEELMNIFATHPTGNFILYR
jgi:hypothetical protein